MIPSFVRAPSNPGLAKALEDLPIEPRSADMALALVRAEAAGYERALRELCQCESVETSGLEVTELAHNLSLTGECLSGCRACSATVSALLRVAR
jgi:hypothetical protein